MRLFKKGAIIGGIWGLLSIVPYSYKSSFNSMNLEILITLLGFPTFIALLTGFHFSLIFIVSPIIGMMFGAGIGYLIEKRCIK